MCNCPRKTCCKRHRFKKVTHCIFDLDGTLLDSEILFHQFVKVLCEKFGKIYTDKLRKDLYGATNRHVCKTVVNELNIDVKLDDFEKELHELEKEMISKAPLKKGAQRLIDHLVSHRIPIAVATNSNRCQLQMFIDSRPNFAAKFHHMVCVDDVGENRGKPFPDIYKLAASKFPKRPKPHSCLVFEDTTTGLKAAVAAGMQVVLVPTTSIECKQIKKATQVLYSLQQFKPEHFGLPSLTTPGYCRPDICNKPTYWA